MKSILEEYVISQKPVNHLANKDDQDKSIDISINSCHNYSLISEDKLHSYAQKTKKLNIEKITSFKSLNFTKQKNLENKNDNEHINIGDTCKGIFNASETHSTDLQKSKFSPIIELNNSKGVSNPFNISNKINNFNKTHTNSDKTNRTVKFETEDFKENILNKDNLKHFTTNSNINNVGNELINSFTKNKLYKDEANLENLKNDFIQNNITKKENNPINAIIDNKLRSLVSDTKIMANKVLKTGSLLSILNFGIKSTSILVGSKINVSEVS